ncbi:PD-(D/E)XK nuclease family protein, partial [Candidatus Poseidoniales archaeon]|nr:PD-(D/E)XK nuclease family protein [Candidatus Poseidoniales archaeon]
HDASWPAEQLLSLPEKHWPQNKNDLILWATERVKKHLNSSLESMKTEWSKHDRKAGQWEDVDVDRCHMMATNGILMHINEVEKCLLKVSKTILDDWRNGARPQWPAPDGRGFQLDKHPLSQEGDVTWIEAWEISRPWFVDPDAKPFMMNAVHPEHWFQGEYDLVYSWDGAIRIIDIKASLGNNDRSGDYVKQLRMYAFLWWHTHEKQQEVDGLEIWYLAANSQKMIEKPTIKEMDEMGVELKELWGELREVTPDIEQCPPMPAPMRSFEPGGIPSDKPVKQTRCERCDWSIICPNGTGHDEHPHGGTYQLPGSYAEIEGDPIDELEDRHDIVGHVHTLIHSQSGRAPRITITQANNAFADVQVKAMTHSDGTSTVPEGLEKGDLVRVEKAFFQLNYKGAIVLKVDPFSKIVKIDSDEEVSMSLLKPRARWNIMGTVVYRTEKRGVSARGEWCRKGLMILDNTGAIKIEGWQADWGPQYDMLELGDTVIITNVGMNGWAALTTGEIYRSSRLHIVAED